MSVCAMSNNRSLMSVCAMSGQSLTEAVISKKTGHIFERATIEKHLNSFPYCPVTNQPLSHEDLIPILQNTERIARQTQTPITHLAKLQHQYSTLSIEGFLIRKDLKEAKQQLANCLSETDAATRVIAKLLKTQQQTQRQIQFLTVRLQQLMQQNQFNRSQVQNYVHQ